MRMLRIVRGKTLKNGISNETIRNMTGVKKIDELEKDKPKKKWKEEVERDLLLRED